MVERSRRACLAAIAAALCAFPAVEGVQAAAATNGSVLDATGSVLVRRGARNFPATRGVSLQPGDQIFVLDGASLTLGCPGQNAVKVTTVGTFTYSGCQAIANAAAAPPPAAPGPGGTPAGVAPGAGATEPVVGSGTGPALPTEAASTRRGGGGATLGIIGGLAVIAVAAGGGGGGGGSSSPPASP